MKKGNSILLICICFSLLSHAQEWIQWDSSRGVPENQLPRGREADYKPLYIIRAKHAEDLIPGKFNGDWRQAYISYEGGEHIVSSFEFFVGANVKWQPASNGVIPANAVVSGGRPGAIFYIGRVKHNGSIVPGKIDPANGGLHIPYGGREIRFTEYEQLVYV